MNRYQQYVKRPVSMYEPREGFYNRIQLIIPENRTTTSMYQMAGGGDTDVVGNGKRSDSSLPQSDEVKRRTDCITRCIQELWTVMQDMTIKDEFVRCSDKIRIAVAELSEMFSTVMYNYN